MKNYPRFVLALLLLTAGLMPAMAQHKLSGQVTDDTGDPLPGVTVIQEGANNAVATDIDGKYTIFLKGEKPVIEARYVGYAPSKHNIKPGQTVLNIVMKQEANAMDELVVVGYGQQKKINLTGAVEQVNSEVFEGRPTANMSQMLEGVIPNLNIDIADGKATRGATLNVRGMGSINGGNALVLIDGVEGEATAVNPNDIESVSVLKDAASSAIYGARAPFGVILITTKKAQKGKPKVTYSSNYTWSEPMNTPDVVTDGYDYAYYTFLSQQNRNGANPASFNSMAPITQAWLDEYKIRKENGNFGTVYNYNGDWGLPKNQYVYFEEGYDPRDVLYKDNVFSTTQGLNISGSDDKFDYYLSGRYYHYSGLFDSPTQTDEFNSYILRFKAGYQMTKWLKVSNSLDFSRRNTYVPKMYVGGTDNVFHGLFLYSNPCIPVHNPDGTLTRSGAYGVGGLLEGESGNRGVTERLRNTTSFTADLWKSHWTLSGDFTFKRMREDYTNRDITTPYAQGFTDDGVSIMETNKAPETKLYQHMRHTDEIIANIYTNFNYTVAKKHDIGVMVGYNYESYRRKGLAATNDDLLTTDVDNLQLAFGTENKVISSSWQAYQFAGLFYRLNYSFDNRYLLEFNGRYDGSSRFPENHRWAFFPSASAGWRVDQEKFWHVNPAIVSSVKVRASYGKLGNALGLNNYQYKQTMSPSTGSYLLDGQKQRYVRVPAAMPEDLTWESSATIDVGGDLAFLNRRLTLTGDWYKRMTTDMIVTGPQVPDVFGASSPKGNYAKMSTYGFEISLGYRDSFKLAGKNFNWSVRATLSDAVSYIDEFNNPMKTLSDYSMQASDHVRNTSYSKNYYPGMRVGDIWGFIVDGLYQTQEQCDEDQAKAAAAGQKYYNPLFPSHSKSLPRPGDVRVRDLNNNGYIDRGSNTADDPGDRTVIGNETPRYRYSFSLSAEWNGFSVSALFQGVGKQDWYPGGECGDFWGKFNRPYGVMPTWHVNNTWTEDNPDAYLPILSTYNNIAYTGGDKFANTRYLQNAAYCRLKNLQIGYKLPKKIVNAIKLQNVEVYLSGENLYTWSPLYKRTKDINVANINSMGDNELSGTPSQGASYPTMRAYSMGLNVTF